MNKSKTDVLVCHYLDGKFIASKLTNRMVYTDSDGTMWANWGKTKRQVVLEKGICILRLHAVTIPNPRKG